MTKILRDFQKDVAMLAPEVLLIPTANACSQIKLIRVIFTHSKLWVTVARHIIQVSNNLNDLFFSWEGCW